MKKQIINVLVFAILQRTYVWYMYMLVWVCICVCIHVWRSELMLGGTHQFVWAGCIWALWIYVSPQPDTRVSDVCLFCTWVMVNRTQVLTQLLTEPSLLPENSCLLLPIWNMEILIFSRMNFSSYVDDALFIFSVSYQCVWMAVVLRVWNSPLKKCCGNQMSLWNLPR